MNRDKCSRYYYDRFEGRRYPASHRHLCVPQDGRVCSTLIRLCNQRRCKRLAQQKKEVKSVLDTPTES